MHKNIFRKKKMVYMYVLDGVVTANRGVGISGYMAYILSIEETCDRFDHMGHLEIKAVNS
jgi:hypothetical protein